MTAVTHQPWCNDRVECEAECAPDAWEPGGCRHVLEVQLVDAAGHPRPETAMVVERDHGRPAVIVLSDSSVYGATSLRVLAGMLVDAADLADRVNDQRDTEPAR